MNYFKSALFQTPSLESTRYHLFICIHQHRDCAHPNELILASYLFIKTCISKPPTFALSSVIAFAFTVPGKRGVKPKPATGTCPAHGLGPGRWRPFAALCRDGTKQGAATQTLTTRLCGTPWIPHRDDHCLLVAYWAAKENCEINWPFILGRWVVFYVVCIDLHTGYMTSVECVPVSLLLSSHKL